MRRHLLGLVILTLDLSLLLGYNSNHRRPLAPLAPLAPLTQTLRKLMTAYFHHYRAGYLVGLHTYCVLVTKDYNLYPSL